jgi:glutaredoxin 3
MAKRQVQVFTAGCPLCESAVQLVRELAGPDDDVVIRDLSHDRRVVDEARSYGVSTVPAVVVGGELAACGKHPGPEREQLMAAGLGKQAQSTMIKDCSRRGRRSS